MSALRRSPIEWILTLVAVLGLVIDAYVHAHIAGDYRLVRTSALSQADLFRVEAGVAILTSGWLLLRPGRLASAVACVVAAGGVAAVTFYYYVDPGRWGPIPDMYEPVWYPEKSWSFYGEALAAVAAFLLLLVQQRQRRSRGRASAPE